MGKKSKNKAKSKKHIEPIKMEIWGIIFFLIALVVGISLFSYHPADFLFWLKSARPAEAHNLFGTVGAHLAGGIFFLLGFSSFWLVAIFVSLAFLSFRGHAFPSPKKSIVASLFLIFSFSGTLGLQTPSAIIYRGSEVMSGGFAGVHIAEFMKGFLNYFGAYVLLAAVFFISLMVCTHISFGWVLSRVSLWLVGIMRRLKELSMKKKERRRKKRVRKEIIEKERAKPRPKVTIVEPQVETSKQAEQESFPFMNMAGEFKLPSLDLLNEPPGDRETEFQRESLEMNARRVEKKLADFGVDGEVVEILPGPVITMYEFKPAPGVKISKVAGLSDDLGSVRILPEPLSSQTWPKCLISWWQGQREQGKAFL